MPEVNVGIVGLGNVGLGTLTILGENAEQITLYKSVGVAVMDLAAASAALERAEELGLGASFEL